MWKNDHKFILTFLLIGWTGFILYGSLAPGDALPETGWLSWIPHFDKGVHFGFYFVETSLLLLVFRPGKWRRWLTLLMVIAFSGVIEYLQGRYFGRSSDVWDLAANTAGAAAGFLVVPLLERRCLGRRFVKSDRKSV